MPLEITIAEEPIGRMFMMLKLFRRLSLIMRQNPETWLTFM